MVSPRSARSVMPRLRAFLPIRSGSLAFSMAPVSGSSAKNRLSCGVMTAIRRFTVFAFSVCASGTNAMTSACYIQPVRNVQFH